MSEARVLRLRDEAIAALSGARTTDDGFAVLRDLVWQTATDLAESVYTALTAKGDFSNAEQNATILCFLEKLARAVADSFEAQGMAGHAVEAECMAAAQDAYLDRLETLFASGRGGTA